ncbi:hypothetical protein PENTCL1PPCAC_14632, partial [Pristionchus entomophagus]
MISMLVCTGEVDEPATIVLRESLRRRYNLTITDGWMVMDHWRNNSFQLRPFLVTLYADIVMLCSFLPASTLATMTFYYIHVNTSISEWYRKVQRTVLIALCAQTIVPLLLVYFPYANKLNAPFLRSEGIIDVERSAVYMSAFPFCDAIDIILLIRDYRRGLLKLV